MTQLNIYENVRSNLAPPEAPLGFLWSRTSMLKEVSDVLQAVGDWSGLVIRPDRKGLHLELHGVRLGLLRWNGRIDLPFGPTVADELMDEWSVTRDPLRPGRIGFDVRTSADVAMGVGLFRLAYLIVDPRAIA